MHKTIATKAYKPLLALSALAALGAALTLVPWPWASSPNLWGYSSLCSYAPAATLFCALIAGASCVLRASLNQKSPGFKEWLARHALALAFLGLILGFALWAGFAWSVEEGRFIALRDREEKSVSVDFGSVPDGASFGAKTAGELSAKVLAEFQGGKLKSVKVLESAGIPPRVESLMVERMIGRSDLEVDAVTGATLSSYVLRDAVKDAAIAAWTKAKEGSAESTDAVSGASAGGEE